MAEYNRLPFTLKKLQEVFSTPQHMPEYEKDQFVNHTYV